MAKASAKKRSPAVTALRRECRELIDTLPDRESLKTVKRLLSEVRRGRWMKAIDNMERSGDISGAFAAFLRSRPPVEERRRQAEESIAAGKGVNWRKVRDDV